VLKSFPIFLAAVMAAGAAKGADVDFRPALWFGLFHDGNLHVVSFDPATQQSTGRTGDDAASLGIDFAVHRTTPTSTLDFSYRPSYVRYRVSTQLDYLANDVTFGYTNEFSKRTTLASRLDLSRTDAQGISRARPDLATNLVPRTTVTRGHGDVGGTVAVARRGLVDWQVRASADRYDPVPGVAFNDSRAFGARGGWRYEKNQRSTIGLAVDVDWFGYDLSPSVVVQTLALAGTNLLGRNTTLNYGAGLSRSASDGASSTDPTFFVSVDRRITDVSTFVAGVRRSVSPGVGVRVGPSGSTLDTGGWAAYTHVVPRRGLTGSVYGAYWSREGLDFGAGAAPTIKTGIVSGAIGWAFTRFVSLNLSYAWYDQRVAGTSAPTRYSSYGLYLRWAMRGR
jgi:hypothetical protein